LNDRTADNWRPLLQIANLCGGDWPQRAREAACLLSGEGHESTSINVEVLIDIHLALGEAEAMRSVYLVAALIADPERPWAEWGKNGKPLTQRQLATLLRPFGIVPETVHIDGLSDAKGYKRESFKEAWAAYLPAQNLGQNTSSPPVRHFYPSKRPNADGPRVSSVFPSVQKASLDGPKNDDLADSRKGLDAWTDGKSETDAREILTTKLTASGTDTVETDAAEITEPWPRVCEHCGAPSDPMRRFKPTKSTTGNIGCTHAVRRTGLKARTRTAAMRTEHKPLTSWQVHRECEIYEILNFGKSRYGRDSVSVTRTYLIQQAAPPNF
jgi:Protein of unknown function (DUF3631)